MMRVTLVYDVIDNVLSVEFIGSIVSITWLDGYDKNNTGDRKTLVASVEELRFIECV